jgi:recombinational DNA repair protein RecR
MDNNQEIKKLSPLSLKDLKEKNKARLRAGLSEIPIKIRKCMGCGAMFESSESRYCGCAKGDNILESHHIFAYNNGKARYERNS